MTNEAPRKSTTRKATAAHTSTAVSDAIPSDDGNANPSWLVRALFTLAESVTAQTQVQREILEVLHASRDALADIQHALRLGADYPAALRASMDAVRAHTDTVPAGVEAPPVPQQHVPTSPSVMPATAPALTSGTGPATPPAIPVTPHTASTPQSVQAGVVTTPIRPHLTPGVVVHAIGTGGVAPPPTRAVSSAELTPQPIHPIPAASHGATAPSNANVIVSPLVAPAS